LCPFYQIIKLSADTGLWHGYIEIVALQLGKNDLIGQQLPIVFKLAGKAGVGSPTVQE
jgi:hypothetical protein